MPITPEEAGKALDTKYAAIFKTLCADIDEYLSAYWFAGKGELHFEAKGAGMEVINMAIQAYSAKGWAVEYSLSARNESYLVFKA